jgi:hypothetical protein
MIRDDTDQKPFFSLYSWWLLNSSSSSPRLQILTKQDCGRWERGKRKEDASKSLPRASQKFRDTMYDFRTVFFF